MQVFPRGFNLQPPPEGRQSQSLVFVTSEVESSGKPKKNIFGAGRNKKFPVSWSGVKPRHLCVFTVEALAVGDPWATLATLVLV